MAVHSAAATTLLLIAGGSPLAPRRPRAPCFGLPLSTTFRRVEPYLSCSPPASPAFLPPRLHLVVIIHHFPCLLGWNYPNCRP